MRLMTYHDNRIELASLEGYAILEGSYTITDFSVTDGQDPDGCIYNGLEVPLVQNELSFRIGRKGSAKPANWWNATLEAQQTTFDHPAGTLNFALLGTLRLTLTGGILGGGSKTFSFTDVGLAQGRSGLSNNWWFGGKQCVNIHDNRVLAEGEDEIGSSISFCFSRGGNGVNTVDLHPVTVVATWDWMGRIDGSTRLDCLMMPGSHDAGMSELHHCAPPKLAEPSTQTQAVGIGQQLEYGSRYFDLRIDFDHGELVTYHRTNRWGCNGQSLISILDQTRDFLSDNPSEAAIFKLTDIRNYGSHHAAETEELIDALLAGYADVLYTDDNPDVNLASLELDLVRGKLIVTMNYGGHTDTAAGRFKYIEGTKATTGNNLTVYDRYADTRDYEQMAQNQLAKWEEYGGEGMGYLFLLSWTLTPDALKGDSVKALANEANGHLPDFLHEQISLHKLGKPNIVFLDFIDGIITQSILLYNEDAYRASLSPQPADPVSGTT